MAIKRKFFDGVQEVIAELKSWAQSVFAPKNHKHDISDISQTATAFLPNYNAGKILSAGTNARTEHTITSAGWCIYVQKYWTWNAGQCYVNGVRVGGMNCWDHVDSSGYETVYMFPVGPGDVVTVTRQAYSYNLTFYPCRG